MRTAAMPGTSHSVEAGSFVPWTSRLSATRCADTTLSTTGVVATSTARAAALMVSGMLTRGMTRAIATAPSQTGRILLSLARTRDSTGNPQALGRTAGGDTTATGHGSAEHYASTTERSSAAGR